MPCDEIVWVESPEGETPSGDSTGRLICSGRSLVTRQHPDFQCRSFQSKSLVWKARPVSKLRGAARHSRSCSTARNSRTPLKATTGTGIFPSPP